MGDPRPPPIGGALEWHALEDALGYRPSVTGCLPDETPIKVAVRSPAQALGTLARWWWGTGSWSHLDYRRHHRLWSCGVHNERWPLGAWREMRGTEGVASLEEMKAVLSSASRLWVTGRGIALTE
jgi:hypothetical protein